ncbi:MAG: PilC/PilY family type IV pilus protein, partial [Methylomonas sp.]|nr:PilC/PilY family type IV pilus protein [Methylomonas sp.]
PYYIAGLAYYANTQNIRKDIGGTQTVNNFMVDNQEYSTSPLVGKMNMLWLAGKYGGFNDFNANGVPDDEDLKNKKPSEWDADGDGEPDKYVLANKPEKLVKALNAAFEAIKEKMSAAAAIAANSTRLTSDTLIYQGKFNSADWSGRLEAYSIDSKSGALTSVWEASKKLPEAKDRAIFTYNPLAEAGKRGIEFYWDNLNKDADNPPPSPHSQQYYLNTMKGEADGKGQLRVDWLRGNHSNEQGKTGGIFRARTNLLGDIINSDPLYVGVKDYGYASLPAADGGDKYSAFQKLISTRKSMIYVGANDGMLHGFDASSGAGGGSEVFAYIPNALFPELGNLTSPGYAHQYYVDGKLAAGDVYDGTAWTTVLVGTTGGGGRAVFALDVTDPDKFGAASALWEFTNVDDADLGFTLGRPEVVRTQDGHWVSIVANGYNSDNGHAVLFVLDARTGAVLQKIDTGVGTTTLKNGLSSPLAVDSNNDRGVDAVYAGDLYGNLWKFDLSGEAGKWPVPTSPFFVACSKTGTECAEKDRQPITGKPNVGSVSEEGSDQNGKGVMIYFGTGKYFETGDNIVGENPQVQTFYGLWDNGVAITDRTNLQEQTIIHEGSVTTVAGKEIKESIRILTDHTICYAEEGKDCKDAEVKSGWALDLISPNGAEGERMIGFPALSRGFVIFSTLIPEADPCSGGGRSYLMELDVRTGGRSPKPPFDVDNDGSVTGNDKVKLGDEIVSASGEDLEHGITTDFNVLSGVVSDIKVSNGEKEPSVVDEKEPGDENKIGIRRSWRQLK